MVPCAKLRLTGTGTSMQERGYPARDRARFLELWAAGLMTALTSFFIVYAKLPWPLLERIPLALVATVVGAAFGMCFYVLLLLAMTRAARHLSQLLTRNRNLRP